MLDKKVKGVIFDLDDTLFYSFMNKQLQGQLMPRVREVFEHLAGMPDLYVGIATNRAGAGWHVALTMTEDANANVYPTPEKEAVLLLDCVEKLPALRQAHWRVSLYDQRIEAMLQRHRARLDAAIPDDPHDPASIDQSHELFTIDTVLDQVASRMSSAFIERGGQFTCMLSTSPDDRKPKPGALLAFCKVWNVDPAQCIFVGDMDGSKRDRNGVSMDSDIMAARNAGMPFLPAPEIQRLVEMVRGE